MAKVKTAPKKSTRTSTRKTRAAAISTAKVTPIKPAGRPTEKPAATKSAPPEASKGRRVLGRLRRRERPATMPRRLPNSFQISKRAWFVLWDNKEVFFGLAVIYGILNFVLVQGFGSATSLLDTKDQFSGLVSGPAGVLTTGIAMLGVLATSRNSTTADAATAIQFFLVLITSLAIVWLLRHAMAGEKVSVRDGFYRGMAPLIPVFLIVLVIILQLIPFILGGSLFSIVVGSGIVIKPLEIAAASVIFFILVVASLFWLTSSIIAMYVATLPDMTPVKALRAAGDLVRWRRWSVLRKLLFLPIALVAVLIVIMLPVVLLATRVAPYVFFGMSMVIILVVHSYLYTLYRELLA